MIKEQGLQEQGDQGFDLASSDPNPIQSFVWQLKPKLLLLLRLCCVNVC